MNINFHLRNLKENTPQKVIANFFLKNKRYKIDTGLKIEPKYWSKPNQKANPSHPKQADFNKRLKSLSEAIVATVYNTKMSNKWLYADEIQREINKQFKIGECVPDEIDVTNNFIAFIDYHITTKGDRSPETISALLQTKRNIIIAFGLCSETTIKKYFSLGRNERRKSDLLVPTKVIEFDEINARFVERFKSYLLNATYLLNGEYVHYKKNSIAKNIKILKQFINAALNEGYIKNMNYKTVKAEWEEADMVYTTWEEIEAIKNAQLEEGSMEDKVRDIYVFNCYCGLRFSDLCRLSKFSFFRENGQLMIKIRQKKTDNFIY
ncbi:MAG: phage integrase SAM-like domain-containing protein [Bacteroidetes bacterium]|nr:phage integrase SAM-like domain-containing protein [Bacteroidota bacterium]